MDCFGDQSEDFMNLLTADWNPFHCRIRNANRVLLMVREHFLWHNLDLFPKYLADTKYHFPVSIPLFVLSTAILVFQITSTGTIIILAYSGLKVGFGMLSKWGTQSLFQVINVLWLVRFQADNIFPGMLIAHGGNLACPSLVLNTNSNGALLCP